MAAVIVVTQTALSCLAALAEPRSATDHTVSGSAVIAVTRIDSVSRRARVARLRRVGARSRRDITI